MESGESPLLQVDNLCKSYAQNRDLIQRLQGAAPRRAIALDGVSFTLNRNEVLGIVGEFGSGKTTTARCLVRLENPEEGRIDFDGQDVLAAEGEQLRLICRQMQMIFQDPYTALNPRFTVYQAISEPALVHGLVEEEGAKSLVKELMYRVGLPESAADVYPRALSGGQRQRVAIARALALKPKALIADEAVSALDVSIQAQILNLFAELVRELGVGIIFISHQLAVIAQLSDRVAIMYLGRIVETGKTADVFMRPRHPYTMALLKAHPTITSEKLHEPALKGEIPSPYAVPQGCRFHTRCPFVEERCRQIDPPAASVAEGHLSWCHVLPHMKDV